MKYRFQQWQDGDTNTTKTLAITADVTLTATYLGICRITFQSSPINVQATVNGTPVPAGQYVELPAGTQITVTVPTEVVV